MLILILNLNYFTLFCSSNFSVVPPRCEICKIELNQNSNQLRYNSNRTRENRASNVGFEEEHLNQLYLLSFEYF